MTRLLRSPSIHLLICSSCQCKPSRRPNRFYRLCLPRWQRLRSQVIHLHPPPRAGVLFSSGQRIRVTLTRLSHRRRQRTCLDMIRLTTSRTIINKRAGPTLCTGHHVLLGIRQARCEEAKTATNLVCLEIACADPCMRHAVCTCACATAHVMGGTAQIPQADCFTICLPTLSQSAAVMCGCMADGCTAPTDDSDESWMRPELDIMRLKPDLVVEVMCDGEWWCVLSRLILFCSLFRGSKSVGCSPAPNL